jgi:glycosyltransferase involved in cell wall biosynthesis
MPRLFSVVIPTFNRSDLFPYAVNSIFDQTLQDFEIIVSDNCSGDDTRHVAQQFGDSRFRYVCTPRHFTIADSWEFARRQASGSLIIMLSDDDVLVSTALQRFAAAADDWDHDFLFSSVAEYRDPTYPGSDKNSLTCPAFSRSLRIVTPDEFVRPLFSLRLRFNMHPSAFVFPRHIADYVEGRTGRFFWTNGVEYSAWPITALFARRIVHIDEPLAVLGRTGKSWGSNLSLCNPGPEKIQAFIQDVDQIIRHAPLHNFTTVALIAEGILTAKHLFPREFAPYDFDELSYLKATMRALRKREALGVDVSAEIDEVLRYSRKYASMESQLREIRVPAESPKTSFMRVIRSQIGKLSGRRIRRRLHAFQLTQRLGRGEPSKEFQAYGDDLGFTDILECSRFLQEIVITPETEDYRADAREGGNIGARNV